MQRAHKRNEAVPVSEMTIVNTFTKLIFGEDAYCERDLSIIEAFRTVEANVLRDSLQEMGEYLRNLGVREMIQLVSRLHQHLAESGDSLPSSRKQPAPNGTTALSAEDRDSHQR